MLPRERIFVVQGVSRRKAAKSCLRARPKCIQKAYGRGAALSVTVRGMQKQGRKGGKDGGEAAERSGASDVKSEIIINDSHEDECLIYMRRSMASGKGLMRVPCALKASSRRLSHPPCIYLFSRTETRRSRRVGVLFIIDAIFRRAYIYIYVYPPRGRAGISSRLSSCLRKLRLPLGK